MLKVNRSKMRTFGTGFRKSALIYLILILVVFVSLYMPGTAFFAYSFIIFISYTLKKMENDFNWGKSWKFGFIFGFVLILSIFIFELGSGWIKLGELYPDALYILMAGVFFELLVSIGEEMSFRGIILPDLINRIGVRDSVIVTSLLFGGLHIPSILLLEMELLNTLIMFATITAAGVLLANLYLKEGLKICCSFHFSWNFFQYHVFSLRSGFGIFSIQAEKTELTGGLAGPEAGIIGLFVIIVGIIISFRPEPLLRKE